MQNSSIHISKAREHNLKNVSVDIPRNKLVIVTGVSGSGKSSLVFDTLYAEGYRKYMESLSSGSRRMLEQIDKPDVDYIKGLSPVIAVAQSGINTNPRSTVATSTEIADYARIIWSIIGEQLCPIDGAPIKKRTIDDCIDSILKLKEGTRIYILAEHSRSKLSIAKNSAISLAQAGWQRLRINGEIQEIDDLKFPSKGEVSLDIVVDRLAVSKEDKSRIADSLELAFKEGSNAAIVLYEEKNKWHEMRLNNSLSCEKCGKIFNEVSPRLFSHNHPEGACPNCAGIGRIMTFLPELVISDESRSIKSGAIKALRFGSMRMIINNRSILRQLAMQGAFDPNIAWKKLSQEEKEFILYGDQKKLFLLKPKPGNVRPVERPFEGVLAMLEKTISETSSDLLRMRLNAFQISKDCTECRGSRLSKRARTIFVEEVSYDEFLSMSVEKALVFVKKLKNKKYEKISEVVKGLYRRIEFLANTGLAYLELGREFSTLSGGEERRVRLATQFGMGLTGVTFVLDEPSIGLHPIDNKSLMNALKDMRDNGNTVVVVEHDEYAMRNGDYIIELGAGAGAMGGEVVFAGAVKECIKESKTLTGKYLSGENILSKPSKDFDSSKKFLTIKNARAHNLKNIDATFSVGAFNVVCGVSGSGKSTLVHDILAKSAAFKLNKAKEIAGLHDRIDGLDFFEKCVLIDQSPIGRSPRSNPATYTKIFDSLRTLYAALPTAKMRGYSAGRFSFNVKGGRCENCQGQGYVSLDMQFLGEVFVKCPSCQGRRYNRETLEVKFKGLSISDVLNLTIVEAIELFKSHDNILRVLETLQEVGLGYLKLGQAANTLSGGEAQRLKLSLELSKKQSGKTLYILDEPTTGLHFDDIDKLAKLLFRLRDAGNTLIVIEHETDIIKMADHIVELGPKGGEAGGELLFSGSFADLKKANTPTSQFI